MANPNIRTTSTLRLDILAAMQLSSGDNTVYTVPTSTSVKIAQATVFNVGTVDVTVQASLTKSGGSARRIYTKVIPAGDGDTLEGYLVGHMLGEAAVITMNASVGSAIDVVISGAVSS